MYESFPKQLATAMVTKVLRIEDADTQRLIARTLEYSKKRRGRALVADLRVLGLRKGARLEPTTSLPDVGKFETADLPLECTFWVAADNARLTHACPLFRLPGVTLDTWAIDIMHTWHLGPVQQYVSLSLHFCIDSGLWAPRSLNILAADRNEVSLLAIKSELFVFYKEIRATSPDWRRKGTEATRLELNMMSRCMRGCWLVLIVSLRP